MKSTLFSAMVLVITTVTNAFAANAAREDNSGLFVWAFLGFCALIVVAQLIPAILMATGALKALTTKKEVAAATVSNK